MTIDNFFVSVIIATYNRNEVLCDSIESVLAQNYDSYELIIVDQSKEHNEYTQAFMEAHKEQFEYIYIENPGLPNARNVGIQAAKGSIILFCDDDVELIPDWILYHVKNYENQSVGCVGGRIVEQGLPLLPQKPNKGQINIWGRPDGNFTSLERTQIKTVRGGNMSFRKSVLDEVGLFDANFIGTATLEESDISYRIINAGYEVVYDPQAELLHKPQHDGNIGWRRNRRIAWYHNYLHNGTLFMLKNKPRYEIIPFLMSQFAIAVKHGLLRGRSWSGFVFILSGIRLGYRTYLKEKG